MTCVNIVDHRKHCTCEVDAVLEVKSTETPVDVNKIRPHKILNNTTVEKAIQLANRIKNPVWIWLYNSGSLKE